MRPVPPPATSAPAPLDSRPTHPPAPLPPYPQLPGRAAGLRGSRRRLGGGAPSEPPPWGEASVGDAGAPPAPPAPAPTGVVAALAAAIDEDLSRFDLRHVDARGITPGACSFLESLNAGDFELVRSTVLARHREARLAAVARYTAAEARMAARGVFPPAVNEARLRSAARCDLSRPGGALHLPTLAQGVVEDMTGALARPGGLGAHVTDGVIARLPRGADSSTGAGGSRGRRRATGAGGAHAGGGGI